MENKVHNNPRKKYTFFIFTKLNYLNKYSLLSGNSGVYLTLNYLIKGTVKTNWMSLFLLDN